MVTTKNETAVGPDLRALSGALSGHSPARGAPEVFIASKTGHGFPVRLSA